MYRCVVMRQTSFAGGLGACYALSGERDGYPLGVKPARMRHSARARQLMHDPLDAGVDIKAIPAQKPDQRDAKALGPLDRQATWRRHRTEDRRTSDIALLQQ